MSDDSAKPARRPGRPPGPCSDRERAQRRTAALKHGRYAATTSRRTLRPCKEAGCPLDYPCEAKQLADAEGLGLESCIADVVLAQRDADVFRQALEDGDPSVLDDLVAGHLGTMSRVLEQGVRQMLVDGMSIEEVSYDADGNEIVREVPHPNARTAIEIIKALGLSLPEQRLTRRSQGEGAKDDAIGDFFGWAQSSRRDELP
ncbi:MAG: hypothetical protein AAGN46_08245 [Acidobacteriota bacterium]